MSMKRPSGWEESVEFDGIGGFEEEFEEEEGRVVDGTLSELIGVWMEGMEDGVGWDCV